MAGKSFGLLPYHLIEEELKQGLLVPFENLEGFRVFNRQMKIARLKEREMGPVLNKFRIEKFELSRGKYTNASGAKTE